MWAASQLRNRSPTLQGGHRRRPNGMVGLDHARLDCWRKPRSAADNCTPSRETSAPASVPAPQRLVDLVDEASIFHSSRLRALTAASFLVVQAHPPSTVCGSASGPRRPSGLRVFFHPYSSPVPAWLSRLPAEAQSPTPAGLSAPRCRFCLSSSWRFTAGACGTTGGVTITALQLIPLAPMQDAARQRKTEGIKDALGILGAI